MTGRKHCLGSYIKHRPRSSLSLQFILLVTNPLLQEWALTHYLENEPISTMEALIPLPDLILKDSSP